MTEEQRSRLEETRSKLRSSERRWRYSLPLAGRIGPILFYYRTTTGSIRREPPQQASPLTGWEVFFEKGTELESAYRLFLKTLWEKLTPEHPVELPPSIESLPSEKFPSESIGAVHHQLLKLRQENRSHTEQLIKLSEENRLLREEVASLRLAVRDLREAIIRTQFPSADVVKEQDVVLAELSGGFAGLEVGGIGYRRENDGMLSVAIIVNSRELEPEREVIRRWVKIERSHPKLRFDFTTLLHPPASVGELASAGFQLLEMPVSANIEE